MLEWKASHGFPDYEISENGDVRRVRGGYGPKLICKEERPAGYYSVTIQGPNGWKHVGVHRIVAEAFLGPCPPDKKLVAHFDGDGQSNHWTNLRWATHSENERDKARHGRNPRGSKAGFSRLKEDEVAIIKGLLSEGVKQPDIAARFGVARTTISSISIGKSWGWM